MQRHIVIGVSSMFLLAACQNPMAVGTGAFDQGSQPAWGGTAANDEVPEASTYSPRGSGAETACAATAEAQGLAVHGVAAGRDVTDADGVTTGRDVMLRVSRGGQEYNVRCNYTHATAEARIMSL